MTVTQLARPDSAPETSRPEISSGRWIPSRAGIINIWRYYDEVFTFHEGRLLLRGPNGSGKSKALELLLPFLFDANLARQPAVHVRHGRADDALEPDGRGQLGDHQRRLRLAGIRLWRGEPGLVHLWLPARRRARTRRPCTPTTS